MLFAFGQFLPKAMTIVSTALAVSFSMPALASTSTSTAVDVTKPIEEAQDEDLAKGDPSFRELFASWSALDTAGPDPFATDVTTPVPVAVPSRNPLELAKISSDYGMRVHPIYGRRKRHNGIDLAAPTGTPVYATADATVERAERSRSYGLVIYLNHGADLETRYAHLSRMVVADGEQVRKGDLIGYVGSTGRSTGPHLHYEVRVDGVAVNPIPYMKGSQQLAEADLDALGTAGRMRPGAWLGQGGD